MKHYSKLTLALMACTMLAGCGTGDRLSKIGKAPEMSQIANPVTQPGYEPVSLPMPAPQNVTKQKNSLWASNRQTFFKDQRASNVGDIITVDITIDDEAKLDNATERSRGGSENAGIDNALGLEADFASVLPEAVDPANLIGGQSSSSYSGEGTVDRKEEIDMKLAAIITQILPNGNMVIRGRQEVVVNFEKRILGLDGVIRPQDIAVDNSISYDQIAEARISYGGEGQITDVQQPRYGQQIYDVIFPF
jgi:flagellar L-ring protein precursor FlgH